MSSYHRLQVVEALPIKMYYYLNSVFIDPLAIIFLITFFSGKMQK